jgi:L-amino acid N-acyltransferase YncA
MVSLRRATMKDWARLYTWRNHEATRTQFRNQAVVTLQAHLDWLKRTLANDKVHLFVAVDGERSCFTGTMRLDLLPKQKNKPVTAEVSITVDSRHRGLGYAALMLGCLEKEAQRIGVAVLRAEVLVSNMASLRAFAEADYEVVSVETPATVEEKPWAFLAREVPA